MDFWFWKGNALFAILLFRFQLPVYGIRLELISNKSNQNGNANMLRDFESLTVVLNR